MASSSRSLRRSHGRTSRGSAHQACIMGVQMTDQTASRRVDIQLRVVPAQGNVSATRLSRPPRLSSLPRALSFRREISWAMMSAMALRTTEDIICERV
eukprot:762434-Hanusia_phi.AAC.4